MCVEGGVSVCVCASVRVLSPTPQGKYTAILHFTGRRFQLEIIVISSDSLTGFFCQIMGIIVTNFSNLINSDDERKINIMIML